MLGRIRETFQAEHDRLILWAPVCMALGIAAYFHLHDEPPVWAGGAALGLCAASAFLFRRAPFLRYAILAALFASLGFAVSEWRTHRIHSPVLAAPLSYAWVSGRIAEIAPTPKGSKLLLEQVVIDKIAPDKTPKRVSVTLRYYDPNLMTGQIVSLHAGLFPPPEPALPGGFDFSRYFFFREIGAVGYGIGQLEAKSLEDSGASGFDLWFAEFRRRLTESIRSHFREPAGTVAAAFITGEVRAIPQEINDDMRTAGLYHLLAVSGMNLSVVAGLAFFSFRFLLAALPALSLRFNIKKWAALLALIASYIYLRVAGSPVSAERAFFMVSLVFLAIILDRDPTPMRSVALAAFCILLYEPEAGLTASFQLSFSATAALVASYEWGVKRFSGAQGWGIRRLWLYFAAVIATSFVAWCATEPFIIYHFNQFSSYSLVANTIADPLVSFILMPLVIAGVLLMPLGLSWLAFTPMQYGVDWLLGIARGVARLPHAMWIVPAPTDTGFLIAALGAIWIYFWKGKWRWFGLAPILAGMATALLYVPPDLFVSGDGKHAAFRREDGSTAMLRGKATSVNAESWARAAGMLHLLEKNESGAGCDRRGCIVKAREHTMAILSDAQAAPEECALSDIVILSDPYPASTCPAALLMDKNFLRESGAVTLWFKGKETRMRQVRPEQGNRPWVNHFEGE